MEYKSENRTCQNCKNDFIIESEDFKFYEKIKVSPPTFCPECRLIRRLCYRENRSLYKINCDKCKKEIISIYNKKNNFTVFCSECWWGDSWDGTDYGIDYDFSKSFFEQFFELLKVVPLQAAFQKGSTNCLYSNGNTRCKDCTLSFDGYESINCYNCQAQIFTRDSIDSDLTWNADHTYENLDSEGVYNTKFVYFSKECIDSSFLFNCLGCSNCFCCVNLRNKKYQIFNKQYTKEEYEKEIQKWNLGSYKIIEKTRQKFWDLYLKTPRRFAIIINSHNVTGDNIRNVKNCKTCFTALNGIENCKYIFLGGLLLKDSYDVTFGGDISNILYEVNGVEHSQRCFFSRGCNDSMDIFYSDRVYFSSNLFGCTKLRNKKYCILNKQYTKEKYEELVPKIIEHMNTMPYIDKKGRVYKYGEFFPYFLSSWAYNETQAQIYFPLNKQEALENGFNWYDEEKRDYNITLKTENLLDDIKDVSSSILEEIIECNHKDCNHQCTKAFRILPNELQFYKQMNIALPRLCPNCRFCERIKMKNPLKLWHRKCMKEGCNNEFETAISPERKEIVYCEKCYQNEFI